MFGYIRPLSAELKVRQNELYKGLYCGLCKTIGRTVGKTARLTLSYDAVFLSLLLAALRGEAFQVKPGRCALHVTKRRPVAVENEPLRLAAAAGSVLFAYKVEDECRDEKGLRRLAALFLRPKCRRIRRKAERCLPGDLSGLAAAFERFSVAEKETAASDDPSAEQPAECMGEILGLLFSACHTDALACDVLFSIGRHIGRWVYFMDAADDFAKDIEKERFNPFFPEGPDPDRLFAALEEELCGVDRYLSALRGVDEDVSALLRNILYQGMYQKELQVLYREKTSTEEGSSAVPQKKRKGFMR